MFMGNPVHGCHNISFGTILERLNKLEETNRRKLEISFGRASENADEFKFVKVDLKELLKRGRF